MDVSQMLLVGAGSAFGGMARFAVAQFVRTGGRLPWANETFELLRSGQGFLAAIYALVSLVGGLGAVFLGYWASR